jgi:hypothetical protein
MTESLEGFYNVTGRVKELSREKVSHRCAQKFVHSSFPGPRPFEIERHVKSVVGSKKTHNFFGAILIRSCVR